MNRFAAITPVDVAHAWRLLAGQGRVALAGGVDILDLMKQGLLAPESVVNLKGLTELQGITALPGGGLRVGALARLSELADHPLVRRRYIALAEAAREAATPQIRNLATVGGNLLQRPRCWYFRHPDVHCLKKGGEKCYAIGGLNRYNAILGGGPSFIVHPSNLATALLAFGTKVKIVGPAGSRTLAIEKFFILPSVDPRRENVLGPGEILTAVELPAPPPGSKSAYIEAREKQTFDWPLVSVAAVIARRSPSRAVRYARVVMGAVAPIPWRSHEAEAALSGMQLDEDRARAAAEAALNPAQAMSDNRYKVTIAKVLVRRAILKAGAIEEA